MNIDISELKPKRINPRENIPKEYDNEFSYVGDGSFKRTIHVDDSECYIFPLEDHELNIDAKLIKINDKKISLDLNLNECGIKYVLLTKKA